MTPEPDACALDGDGCITCGDVAVPLEVVEVLDGDARCRSDDGREEVVAVDLVGPVTPGDRLLVHARVAIDRLDPADAHAPPEALPDATPSTTRRW